MVKKLGETVVFPGKASVLSVRSLGCLLVCDTFVFGAGG